MNLLIDNCTLIRLVHSEAYGQYLIELVNQVQSGHITILTHDLIIEEWQKHKAGNKKRIVKKLAKQHQLPAKAGGELLPAPMTVDHIDIQYQQIDRLLQNALCLHTPEQINIEFAERYRKRLAPFHNKLNSQNDWEVIGSAGLYCELNGILQLYFVSWNDGEFADPEEKEKTIHPDLQQRFPRVKLCYFREMSDFLAQLAQLVLPDHLLSFNIVRNEKFSYKASVRKHELDSLYHLLKNTYEEVAFVPPHILKKYHPFAKPVGGYTFFSLFAMNHVRLELVELFEGVEITEESFRIIKPELFTGIRDPGEKLEYVLLRLTNNLVFRLNSDSGDKTVSIRYHGSGRCDCFRCAYHRLEWHHSLAELAKPQQHLHERLKKAYFLYQFGSYSAAVSEMLDLREEAKQQKKFIWYFTCQYNLHHLSFLLGNVFYPHTLSPEQLAELKAIDPIEECVKLKSHTDYDLLAYIADGAFFKASFDTIVQEVTHIEDSYYSFLRGGWSSDSHVQLLIVEFAELEGFMNRNFIVYDAYSNWDRLNEQLVKGLFASHAMRGSENSALQTFDDYLVSALVFYGEAKTIYKYFNRYLLKDIAYEPTNRESGFLQLALTLFDHEKQLRDVLKTFADGKMGRFEHRYNKVFKNLMTVAALLEKRAFDIELFARHLLTFLETEEQLNHFGLESIGDFISRKGKYFSAKLRHGYLAYFLKTLTDRDPKNLEAILRTYPTGRIKEPHHRRILAYIFEKKLRGGYGNKLELLTLLTARSNPAQKQRTADMVKSRLDEQFEFSLFYRAVIFELIPLNRKQLLMLFDEIEFGKKRYTFRSISTGKEDEYLPRLDELLNICFKYNISLKLPQIRRMKDAGPYYSWLLDMEHFDYMDFPFEWVSRYRTDFYYQVMARSKKLKTAILEHLRTNSNPELERSLLKISFYANKKNRTDP